MTMTEYEKAIWITTCDKLKRSGYDLGKIMLAPALSYNPTKESEDKNEN